MPKPPPKPVQTTVDLSDIYARLDAIEVRLDAIDPSTPTTPTIELQTLKNRVRVLELSMANVITRQGPG